MYIEKLGTVPRRLPTYLCLLAPYIVYKPSSLFLPASACSINFKARPISESTVNHGGHLRGLDDKNVVSCVTARNNNFEMRPTGECRRATIYLPSTGGGLEKGANFDHLRLCRWPKSDHIGYKLERVSPQI